MVPGYVLGDPYGNFSSTYVDNLKTMATEDEAVKHCIDEIAKYEGKVAVIREDSPSEKEDSENIVRISEIHRKRGEQHE
jgi:hypothetical protein